MHISNTDLRRITHWRCGDVDAGRSEGQISFLASLLFLLLHFLQIIVNGLGDCFGSFLVHAMACTIDDAELRVL